MKTVGIMFSGGPDSATLLYDLVQDGYNPLALFFDYGQPQAELELAAMKSITQKIGCITEVFDISRLKYNFLGLNGLNRIGFGPNFRCNCPHALFGIAASYLISRNITTLYVGVLSTDFNELEDFSNYLHKLSEAISDLHGENFSILAPYIQKDKVSVLKHAHALNVPIDNTWSCEGTSSRIHCGVCKNCVTRKEAIAQAGLSDTTQYCI